MVVSVAVGIASGLVGALPLLLQRKIARAYRARGSSMSIGVGLVLVFTSLVLMTLEILACYFLVPDSLLVYALVLISTFLVSVAVWAVLGQHSTRTSSKKS